MTPKAIDARRANDSVANDARRANDSVANDARRANDSAANDARRPMTNDYLTSSTCPVCRCTNPWMSV